MKANVVAPLAELPLWRHHILYAHTNIQGIPWQHEKGSLN